MADSKPLRGTVPILHPFSNIAVDIVQAPRVQLFMAYRARFVARIETLPRVLLYLIFIVAKKNTSLWSWHGPRIPIPLSWTGGNGYESSLAPLAGHSIIYVWMVLCASSLSTQEMGS